MSLSDELKAINPQHFEKVARRLTKEHNYSDHDLTTKCASRRQNYPLYDFICMMIENNGKPLSDETMLHAMGIEHMLRTLIAIGEEAADGNTGAINVLTKSIQRTRKKHRADVSG